MKILPANTIVNISSEEKIICRLPKNQINIELLPTRLENNQWQIVLKVINLSQQIKETSQIVDSKDFNRYQVGYYKDADEVKRYRVINLLPLIKEEDFGYQKDTSLIWFQLAKNGLSLEVQSGIKCQIEENVSTISSN